MRRKRCLWGLGRYLPAVVWTACLTFGGTCGEVSADWVQLGECLNLDPQSDAQLPWVDAEGDLCYATWIERVNGNQQVFVKHYDAASRQWVQDGGSLNVDPVHRPARETSLAIYQGTPYVAWSEERHLVGYNSQEENTRTANVQVIYAKCWRGGVWEKLGDQISFNRDVKDALHPRIELDANGTPVVAWWDDGIIAARKWNGSDWEPIGNTLQSGGEPELAIKGAVPYLSWSANDPPHSYVIWVRYYNAPVWERCGGYLSFDQASADHPVLALVNDDIYVSWYETAVPNSASIIKVKKYNAASGIWEQLASGLNINPNQTAESPRVAWWNNGLAVAWSEGSKIFIKHHTYQGWDLIGDNLNFEPYAGGASNPRLAVSGNNLYVAWQEAGAWPSPNRVYIKRHDGLFPTPTSTPVPTFVYVKPNPFLPASSGMAQFYFSDAGALDYTVDLFNLQGRKVRSLHRENQWDGCNDQGRPCEGGVYIFQITSPQGRRSGQIVLIR